MLSRLFGFRLQLHCQGRIPVRPTLNLEALEIRAVPAVIAGAVYSDLNNNGIRDPGEPGIANSKIELHSPTGRVLASATTDSNGHYQFNLQAGVGLTAEELASLSDTGRYSISQPHNPPGFLGGRLTADNVTPLFGGCSSSRMMIVNPAGADQLNLNFGELPSTSLPDSVSREGSSPVGLGNDFTGPLTFSAGANLPASNGTIHEVQALPDAGAGMKFTDNFAEFLLSVQRNLAAINWTM